MLNFARSFDRKICLPFCRLYFVRIFNKFKVFRCFIVTQISSFFVRQYRKIVFYKLLTDSLSKIYQKWRLQGRLADSWLSNTLRKCVKWKKMRCQMVRNTDNGYNVLNQTKWIKINYFEINWVENYKNWLKFNSNLNFCKATQRK